MIRHQREGLVYYRFANLSRYDLTRSLAGSSLQPGVREAHQTPPLRKLSYSCERVRHQDIFHAVFTRLGGVSRPPYASLNVGHFIGDDNQAVEANHRLLCQALGIHRQAIATAHQVHGSNVAVVGVKDRGLVVPQTDALVTDAPGVALMLRFADCVPVLLYDPVRRAVGLAHAGWKGVVGKIAAKTALTMVEAYGTHPEDLVVGIGPGIGPCCYQVGPQVVEAVRASSPDWSRLLRQQGNGSFHFDLWQAVGQQLAEVGVEQMEVAEMCTACRVDEFFSHRAEKGKTGRFGVLIGIRED